MLTPGGLLSGWHGITIPQNKQMTLNIIVVASRPEFRFWFLHFGANPVISYRTYNAGTTSPSPKGFKKPNQLFLWCSLHSMLSLCRSIDSRLLCVFFSHILLYKKLKKENDMIALL